MKKIAIPILMLLTATLMATAWLGHLRYEDQWSFWTALAASWALVLPEYIFNTAATRWGYGTYSGAQMASMHLAFGTLAVGAVSIYVLDEDLTDRQIVGILLMALSMFLILDHVPGQAEETASHPGQDPSREAS